jgi:hypothetical protein
MSARSALALRAASSASEAAPSLEPTESFATGKKFDWIGREA